MSLLLDIFGFLSVVLRGLTLSAQSFAFGGLAFMLFLMRPLRVRVRVRDDRADKAALVFPLVTAAAGATLLAHSHAIANIKDELLIEMSHVPLALFGVAAGWARWLELRLDGAASRAASWVWPIAFVLVGLLLLDYREA